MNKLVSLIILLGLIFIGNVQAQKSNVNEPKPLFQSEEMLNLRLEADFTTVFSVTDDSTYFPAKISAGTVLKLSPLSDMLVYQIALLIPRRTGTPKHTSCRRKIYQLICKSVICYLLGSLY